MLLAKIKGNKVYFGKFVTFLGDGGSIYLLYLGSQPKFQVSEGGGLTPYDPLFHIYDANTLS